MPCSTTVHWKKFISTYVYRRIRFQAWQVGSGRALLSLLCTRPGSHRHVLFLYTPVTWATSYHFGTNWPKSGRFDPIRPSPKVHRTIMLARKQGRRHDFPHGKKCCTISPAGLRQCSLFSVLKIIFFTSCCGW